LGWDAHEWKGDQRYERIRYELPVSLSVFDPHNPVPPKAKSFSAMEVVAKSFVVEHPVEGEFDVIDCVVEHVQEEYSKEMRVYVFAEYRKEKEKRIVSPEQLHELAMSQRHGVITLEEAQILSSPEWWVWTFKIAGLELAQMKRARGFAKMEVI
jgi:hypothetical protein